jgi:DNA-binding response OmpR family regulator
MLMAARPVLVVDDDPKIVDLVKLYLEKAGYGVVTASTGPDALRQMRERPPALVVLDVMLPGVDGLVVTRRVRIDAGRVPILMMSARGTVDDRIRGLVEGADDYMPKPFSPAEMVARVNALLRRSGKDPATKRLRHDDLDIDLERHQVRRAGQPLELTAVEYRILVAILQAKGRVLTRGRLIELLHGLDGTVLDRTIDVHIRRLRAKLGDDADNARYIATVRGVGYRAARVA